MGAFAGVTGLFDLEDVVGLLPEFFAAKPALIEINEKAVRAGYGYVKDNFS